MEVNDLVCSVRRNPVTYALKTTETGHSKKFPDHS